MKPLVRHALLLFGSLGAASAAAAACPEQGTSTEDVDRALEAAERAFVALDREALVQATDAASQALPCVVDPLPRYLLARWHRFQGLRGVVERDPDATSEAFRAARAVEPEWTFPASLVPVGNPVRDIYARADPSVDTLAEVPPPAVGYFLFDGNPGTLRPQTRPTVLQHADDEGSILGTWYLDVGEAMPPYQVAPPPPPLSPQAQRGIGAGALVAGTAAAILYGAALSGKARHGDPEGTQSLSELDAQRRTTNGLVVAAGAAGAVSMGLGVTLVIGGGKTR